MVSLELQTIVTAVCTRSLRLNIPSECATNTYRLADESGAHNSRRTS